MKINASMWLKIVHENFYKGVPMTVLAKKHKVDLAKIKYRTKIYLPNTKKSMTVKEVI